MPKRLQDHFYFPRRKRLRLYLFIGADAPEPRKRHPDDHKPHTRIRQDGRKLKELIRAQATA